MATRSRIGLELADGSVLSAYHHWDGYPEWLGRILKTHYNSKELAAELIDGGDMSSCWTDSIRYSEENRTDEYNSYSPEYYSARGDDCPPRHDANLKEYLSDGEEFAYIFNRLGEWICYNMHQFDDSKLPEVVEIPSASLAV
jgi:hypothetical protein